MSLVLTFLRNQFSSIPYPETNFAGQTIIVTGSNAGLGLETALRNLEKGEAAKRSIEETTGRKGVPEVWQLDLSSYESVKEFARKAEGLKRLDAMVENAGISTIKYAVFEDNESTITTNVVSTFLLGLMILPKLRETATKYNITPHLAIVSSDAHSFTSFPEKSSPNIFQTLNDKKTANMGDRYNVSKLLEVFYCRELAARTRQNNKADVTINLVDPGLCHTELTRDGPLILHVVKFFFARTSEVGSRTLVNAVEAGTESHGQYMSNSRVATPASLVRSPEGVKAQKQVWNELSEKLEKIEPGIMANV